jgi:DNA-binding response OmpR family regulator
MSESATLTAAGVPTVYFIDDSATMREVIKIAFRKENIQVVTCADAATAIAQFDTTAPNAVITDVIMPDKDGYEVCQFIKQHDKFGATPVILMSGVVNRAVAEKAMAVRADELIRKPFQPQDLIARVKNLLSPKSARAFESVADEASDAPKPAPQALSGLFSPAPAPIPAPSVASPTPRPAASNPFASQVPRPAVAAPAALPARPAPVAPPAPAASSAEVQRLRNDVRRLELLVKKLQAELEAEHKYCEALESHFKSQQESE